MRSISAAALTMLFSLSALAEDSIVERYKASDFSWATLVLERDIIRKNGEIPPTTTYCTLATSYDRFITGAQHEIEGGQLVLFEGPQKRVVFYSLTVPDKEQLRGFLRDIGVEYRDAERRCRH